MLYTRVPTNPCNDTVILPILLTGLMLSGPTERQEPINAALTLADGLDLSLAKGSLRVDRGGEEPIWIPPGESLEFQVELDLGLLGDTGLGVVTMASGVEPFVAGLPLPGQKLNTGGKHVGWIRITALGDQLGYKLNHSIGTRFLPQVWPASINSENQTGSENRKREIKIGVRNGEWTSEYRANGHCAGCDRKEHFVIATLPWNNDYHCVRCKRAEHRHWKRPTPRSVPAQALDIVGTVYLARQMIRSGLPEVKTTMVQKSDLWDVTLRRGAAADIKVPAGTFRCREVLLIVKPSEEEGSHSKKFSGLFGIKGALKIWMHEGTGVPVLIEGDVPVGDIVDLHAQIRLAKFRGTPPGFGPK